MRERYRRAGDRRRRRWRLVTVGDCVVDERTEIQQTDERGVWQNRSRVVARWREGNGMCLQFYKLVLNGCGLGLYIS